MIDSWYRLVRQKFPSVIYMHFRVDKVLSIVTKKS